MAAQQSLARKTEGEALVALQTLFRKRLQRCFHFPCIEATTQLVSELLARVFPTREQVHRGLAGSSAPTPTGAIAP